MKHGKKSEADDVTPPARNAGAAGAAGAASPSRGRGRPREVVKRSPGKGLPLERGPEEIPATTRAILDAAYKIILRDGVKSMTLIGVAREAHVDVTTVSYHFGTRVGLIEGILDTLYRAPVAEYVAQLDDLDTIEERLSAYFQCVRIMCEDRDASHVYFEICTQAFRDSALRARLRQFNEWVIQVFLAGYFTDASPEQRLASQLTWAMVDGLDLHRAIGGDTYPADELLALTEKLVKPLWSM